ncbi:arsenic resistance N-acetyltransferase ArsN2 [Pandoraea sp.]|uniref:arsenic resistance N-acetyltransferase ArsN2 n=1 Tax=Pandoraea sp. TaxID=1883445 RepID=UPI0035B196E0
MNDNGIRIRSASADELPRIREMLADCGLPCDDVTPSAGIDFFVAVTSAHSVVGCVGLASFATIGLLRSLAVAEQARGGQIGHALIAVAEAQARRRGVVDVYLLTTTASRLFARQGYDVVERRLVPEVLQRSAQFATLCPASAVCMHKDMGATALRVASSDAHP